MTADKLKQYIALFGGLLSAVLLFLQALHVDLWWFNNRSIDAFITAATSAVPFVIVIYGVYKNTYVVTKKARDQEKHLQEKGLK